MVGTIFGYAVQAHAVCTTFSYAVQAYAVSATFGYTVQAYAVSTTFGYTVQANAVSTTFGDTVRTNSVGAICGYTVRTNAVGAICGYTINADAICAIFGDYRGCRLLSVDLRQGESTDGQGGDNEAGEDLLFHVRSPERGWATGYGCHVTHAPERQKAHLGIVTIDAVDT